MNHQNVNRASGAAIGFVIAFVIFIALIAIVKFSISVPAIDADRGAAISKSLAEIRKTENNALVNPGWIDEKRGIVRLPIETAMQMAEREWQNPAQARADLIARAEKAAAPAPKTAPKPSKFE
ncbi:MAG TPA: hypothetical protein VE344_10555 [Methylomirabilota bacterium]|nr:hypothetical protein [Methylomirabilota bacterium]